MESLPIQIGDVFLYRESELLIMQSGMGGFLLECNVKYDICTFEISGKTFKTSQNRFPNSFILVPKNIYDSQN